MINWDWKNAEESFFEYRKQNNWEVTINSCNKIKVSRIIFLENIDEFEDPDFIGCWYFEHSYFSNMNESVFVYYVIALSAGEFVHYKVPQEQDGKRCIDEIENKKSEYGYLYELSLMCATEEGLPPFLLGY